MRAAASDRRTRGRIAHGVAPARALGAVAAMVGVLALAACGSNPPAPGPTPTPSPTADGRYAIAFAMDFDSSNLLASTPEGAAKVSEQTFFGGSLRVVKSHAGSGQAIQFPAFSDAEEEPGVGLVAMGRAEELPNPGTAAFGFGADVYFDVIGAASDADNGDNVLQRGLASDPTQYKLQVDDGVPSCSVTGADDRLMIKGEALDATRWYRLACHLDAEGLQLVVTALDDQTVAEFAAPGAVGAVEFPEDIPIAIGRKAATGGIGIKKQPDQFNGTLDSVWIGIAEDA